MSDVKDDQTAMMRTGGSREAIADEQMVFLFCS